jgi:threonylcarbamoyladenosine tRNA methylthiotransferase MtaB
MKVAVHTFGCKVNLYESEYIINLLKNKNYSIVDFKEEADIYILLIHVQ